MKRTLKTWPDASDKSSFELRPAQHDYSSVLSHRHEKSPGSRITHNRLVQAIIDGSNMSGTSAAGVLDSGSVGEIGGIYDKNNTLPLSPTETWDAIGGLLLMNILGALLLCFIFEIARRRPWFRNTIFYSRHRHVSKKYVPPPLMSGLWHCNCRNEQRPVRNRVGIFEWLFLGVDEAYVAYSKYEERIRRWDRTTGFRIQSTRRLCERKTAQRSQRMRTGFEVNGHGGGASGRSLAEDHAEDSEEDEERLVATDHGRDAKGTVVGFYEYAHDLTLEHQQQLLNGKPKKDECFPGAAEVEAGLGTAGATVALTMKATHIISDCQIQNTQKTVRCQAKATHDVSKMRLFEKIKPPPEPFRLPYLGVRKLEWLDRAMRRFFLEERPAYHEQKPTFTKTRWVDEFLSKHFEREIPSEYNNGEEGVVRPNRKHAQAYRVYTEEQRKRKKGDKKVRVKSFEETGGQTLAPLQTEPTKQQDDSISPVAGASSAIEIRVVNMDDLGINHDGAATGHNLTNDGYANGESTHRRRRSKVYAGAKELEDIPNKSTLKLKRTDTTISTTTTTSRKSDRDFHLNASRARVYRRRPLSPSDRSLLQYVGLDAFVLIRILRFGFDISFYPGLVSCLVLIPIYATNDCSVIVDDSTTPAEEVPCGAVGFFALTTANLEPGSSKYWAVVVFMLAYLAWFLYRWGVEWQAFITPRLNYLKYGSNRCDSDGNCLDLESCRERIAVTQYQKTVMVEYIPESHRCDQMLYDFFDELFPGQVRRAEVLLHTETLRKLINKRQGVIERYETINARSMYAWSLYNKKMEAHRARSRCRSFCSCKPHVPREVKTWTGPWYRASSKRVEALPYLKDELERLNALADQEYNRIVEEKVEIEAQPDVADETARRRTTIRCGCCLVPTKEPGVLSSTGFVEFKTLATAQAAVALKSHLTGMVDFMRVSTAGDARDIIWPNVTMSVRQIRNRRVVTHTTLLLLVPPYIILIYECSEFINWNHLPEQLIIAKGTALGDFIEEKAPYYIVVFLLEGIMYMADIGIRIFAKNFAKLKARAQVDQVVFLWNFVYRLVTYGTLFFGPAVWTTADSAHYYIELSNALIRQSPIFIGLYLTNGFFTGHVELAQLIRGAQHLWALIYVNPEAQSKRSLRRLDRPVNIKFGKICPPLLFPFLTAIIFSTLVPLASAMASINFFLNAKIYTHQFLFIYTQPYESGGKLMYAMNTFFFITLYVVNFLLYAYLMGNGIVFGGAIQLAASMSGTIFVQRWILRAFIHPSQVQPYASARLIDKDNERRKSKTRKETRQQNQGAGWNLVQDNNLCQQGGVHLEEQGKDRRDARKVQVSVKDSISSMVERYSLVKGRNARFPDPKADVCFDDREGEDDDFFLYRQPELDKTSWDTEPEPYR